MQSKWLDVANPFTWPGHIKGGLKKLNEGADKLIEGMDRSAMAEERYGGQHDVDMSVPSYGRQFGTFGNLAHQYGQQGSSFRGNQQQLGRILADEARGAGVGQRLVGMQARQAADRASAQQFGAIAGARPGMQAMASRNAMLGSAMAQSAVGEQAALGSAQMTLGAQNLYNQHLEGARGQDINQTQVNNNAQLQALDQRRQLSGMQQQAAISQNELNARRYDALVRMNQPTGTERKLGVLRDVGGLFF